MTYSLIDTHSHIYGKDFDEDRNEMIQRAKDAGLEAIYLPNIDSESIPEMTSLLSNHADFCKPMMGLHPCSVKENYQEELDLIKKELDSSSQYIAVGEIGIDLYWDKTFLVQQQDAFRQQIKWAKEKNLPICIHARDSFNEIYEILVEENNENLTGVWHCFSGTLEEAHKVLALDGFMLGIGGVVTFKNAGLDKIVQELPLDKLILETDSPYLTPAPHRGKRNESAYTKLVAEKIAQLHLKDLQEVAEITTRNAKALFKQ